MSEQQLYDPNIPLTPGIGRAVDLVVQSKTVGLRLDHYLATLFPDFSRSLMQKAIEAKCVLLNNEPTKADFKVRVGDRIKVWPPEPARPDPIPEDIALDVLYEDEFLAIVN